MDNTKNSCHYQGWNPDSPVIQLVASSLYRLNYPGTSAFKTVLLENARKENNLQKQHVVNNGYFCPDGLLLDHCLLLYTEVMRMLCIQITDILV
jgi:hypothetical protein